MNKVVTLSFAVLISLSLGFATSVQAQKKHTPKPVWGAIVGGLNDIQNITAAMLVFDMKRAAKVAAELQGREAYISNIKRLPQVVRDGHAKVAAAATKLVAAAKSGAKSRMSRLPSAASCRCVMHVTTASAMPAAARK